MATVATERKVFVGGEWVETGEWLEVRSPYSGEVVGRVAKAGAAETRRAVDAAERAMREPLPAHKRAEILVRVAGYLGRRQDEAARTICAEAGKPMKAARVEASRGMSTYTFAAVEARKLAGEVVPMDASQAGEGKLAFTLRVPRGVVGAISPFNFPLNLVAHKLAPALAAGSPVVLKPASATPTPRSKMPPRGSPRTPSPSPARAASPCSGSTSSSPSTTSSSRGSCRGSTHSSSAIPPTRPPTSAP